MSARLVSAVYTADRGYAWSAVPYVPFAAKLDEFLRSAQSMRPDFPVDDEATVGVVAIDGDAAAFTIRRAKKWDSAGRDADYAAFAFIPCKEAAKVDFSELLCDEFFKTPSKNPPGFLNYDGPASATPPTDAAGRLLCRNRYDNLDPHAIGALFAPYGLKADRWTFTFNGGVCAVTTTPWKR